MTTPWFRLRPLLPVVIATALAACGSDDGDSEGGSPATAAALSAESARIVYLHRDGSVPPPGYRERLLTVTAESSRLVIGDRDSTLSDESVPTDLAAVESMLDRLAESDLPAVLDDGCVGGPVLELEVSDADDTLVREVRVRCPTSRRSAGTELRAIVAPLLAPFESTADGTR